MYSQLYVLSTCIGLYVAVIEANLLDSGMLFLNVRIAFVKSKVLQNNLIGYLN